MDAYMFGRKFPIPSMNKNPRREEREGSPAFIQATQSQKGGPKGEYHNKRGGIPSPGG